MNSHTTEVWEQAGKQAATFLSIAVLAGLLSYTILNVMELGLNSLVLHIVVIEFPVVFETYRYSLILWTLAGLTLALRYTWATFPFLVVSFGVSELAFNGLYWQMCGIPLSAFPSALLEYYVLLAVVSSIALFALLERCEIRVTYLTAVFPIYVLLWIALGSPLMQPHCVLIEGNTQAVWTNFGYEVAWQIAVLISTISTFGTKARPLGRLISTKTDGKKTPKP